MLRVVLAVVVLVSVGGCVTTDNTPTKAYLSPDRGNLPLAILFGVADAVRRSGGLAIPATRDVPTARALARPALATHEYEAWQSPVAISVYSPDNVYLGCWNCPPTDPKAVFRRGGDHGDGSVAPSLWGPPGVPEDQGARMCDDSRTNKPEFRNAAGSFLGCLSAKRATCRRRDRHVLVRIRYLCDQRAY